MAAEDAILAMCEHPSFGVKVCLAALVRTGPVIQQGKTAKKTMNSNKQIVGKYVTLHRVLQE